MRVIRGEPVEVWLRDGRPARFVWRGRMYTVIFVLDRRLITVAEPAPEAGAEPRSTTLADPAGAAAAEPAKAAETELTDEIPSGGNGRECWRLEATPERTLPPTTYELCHDLASDRWSLSRG